MLKSLVSGAFIIVSTLAVLVSPGCATLKPVVDNLPHAIAYAQDAELILTGLEVFEKGYFVARPDAAAQAKVEKGIALARNALDAGIRICDGTTELTAAQIDQAFADFKAAYNDLLALLGPLGVRSGEVGARMGASPDGTYVVPRPLAAGR